MSAEIAAAPPVTASGPPGCAAVAAGSLVTADAAVRALREGGNAVDAVLAAGFAAAVSEPTLSSLGGGGFLLVSEPRATAPVILDFFVDVPGIGGDGSPGRIETLAVTYGSSAQQAFHVGWGTVATPGCFAGYLDAHRRWGRLPLAAVVAPAAHAARHGVELDAVQREFIDVIGAILRVTPQSEELYASPAAGLPFRNPDYADLLDAVASGAISSAADPAYAQPIASAMRANGGLVTMTDLESYAPVVRLPISARRGDARIWTNPPPSLGGSIILEALGSVRPYAEAEALLPALVSALREATDRGRQRLAASMKGTTHVSVIDGDGMVAALSTSNGSGSGVMVEGVSLNNMLGEEDLNPLPPGQGGGYAPGMRMTSMMAPTLVQRDDGSMLVMGTGGSERIRSSIASVIARHLDLGMSAADAIAAGRIHPGAEVIDIEPGVPASVVARIRSGHPHVREWPEADLYFGGVHAVLRAPDGSVLAIGDVRRGGAVAVVAGG